MPFTREELREVRRLPAVEDATGFGRTNMLETDGLLPSSLDVGQTAGITWISCETRP